MSDSIPNVVSITVAAARVEVSEDTMRRYVRAGRVKARQFIRGGAWRVFVDEDGFPVSSKRRA